MLILYVPFSKENAGDLVALVERWKENHIVNTKVPIKILYHQDEYDSDEIHSDSEVYICAHGYPEENLMAVGNHSNQLMAQFITMQTVSDRFDYDLLYVSSQISSTHLYCCGNLQKNQALASLFQSVRVRPEDNDVFYYAGSVTIADIQGRQWALGENQVIPIQNMRMQLSDMSTPFQIEDSSPDRFHIKQNRCHEKGLQSRRDKFFSSVKDHRASKVASMRFINNSHLSLSLP